MENKEIALKIAEVLNNKKGQDVLVMDIAEHSSFADYFVIATGGNERLIKALSEEVEDKMAELGLISKNVEGKHVSGWILMDYGDIIVNIFSTEQRAHYNIEKVWGDCDILELNFEN